VRRGASRIAALALLVLALPVARGGDRATWRPENTFVFMAGIIEWPKAAGLSSFTDNKRLDTKLAATLRAAGVPDANLVFLEDKDATRDNIRTKLGEVAGRAGEGSTFIFYFEGHGALERGKTYFCNYDIDPDRLTETGFSTDDLYSILDARWKGERAVLFADCCHSGGLASVVSRLDAKSRKAACLASATASNRSTGNWTFTQGLIDAFSGYGIVDANGDDEITLDELDGFVHDEMKYGESQLTHAVRSRAFETDFVLRKVKKHIERSSAGGWTVGQYVEAFDGETWYGARVLKVEDARWRVHYMGWDAEWDEWVEKDRIRKIERKPLEIGKRYDVAWEEDKTHAARVIESCEDWFYYVHYEGRKGKKQSWLEEMEDEWITSDRASPVTSEPQKPEFVAAKPRAFAVGDKVATLFCDGAWYFARITGRRGALYLIEFAYDGSAASALEEEMLPADGETPKAGERVLGAWGDYDQMYPAKVKSVKDKACELAWEDGSPASDVPTEKVVRLKP
jgi:hypothetical protein